MTKTLAQLITDAQILLLDDGTRFSTATVTAAVRSALRDFNIIAPSNQGEILDVTSGQKEYPLNALAFASLIEVTNVQSYGTNTYNDEHIDLPYDFYFDDDQPQVRLRTALSSGYLLVRFNVPHTVSGLDSETTSSIPAYYDNTLIHGACFYSCLIRATGRIETINLNQGVTEQLETVLTFYRSNFIFGLSQAIQRKPPKIQETTQTWDDQPASWDDVARIR